MNKRIATVLLVMILALACQAEAALKKVYNEDINPVEQIDQGIGTSQKHRQICHLPSGRQLVSMVFTLCRFHRK